MELEAQMALEEEMNSDDESDFYNSEDEMNSDAEIDFYDWTSG